MTYEDNYLAHYGIKGQRYGVRRFQNEDGTLTEEGKRRYGYYDNKDGSKDYKRLQKDAAKDAKEYARAKAYYGEGAGTRRKQIKNLISERMKDEDYKKEFERLLGSQDMSKAQKAANRERKVQDTKNAIGKTARGIKNLAGLGGVTLGAIALYGVATKTGVGRMMTDLGKTTLKSAFRFVRKGGRVGSMVSGAGNAANAFMAFMGRY